jgi:hypothetical protein
MPINFTVNGASRIVRGEAGEPAIVTMNGKPANINTPLEANSEITIEESTAGESATYRVNQLEEYTSATVSFEVNGRYITCPKFVEVNGSLEPGDYEIKEGDVIETRSFYTVGQVAEFMDVEVDPDREIYVNNREADMDTLVYENFSIEWTTLDDPFATTSEPETADDTTTDTTGDVTTDDVTDDTTDDITDNVTDDTAGDTTGDVADASEPAANDTTTVSQRKTVSSIDNPNAIACMVTVNGESVTLYGKEHYIFVDIFDWFSFDLNAGEGRAIITRLNGRDAQYTEELHDGDTIELYWKEK